MDSIGIDTVSEDTQGFVTGVQAARLGAGVRLSARHDAARFHIGLFDALGIGRPDSLSRASDARLADFLAGRVLVHVAQSLLGLTQAAVGITADRAPDWPPDQSGSISHTHDRCACLLLPAGHGTPGLDVETIATGPALDAILDTTLTPDEVALLPAPDLPRTATLCFSAKEALFKALFPTVRHVFGFDAARLTGLGDDKLVLALTQTLHPTLPAGRTFTLWHETGADHVSTWLVHR